jgi:hypothetical protein
MTKGTIRKQEHSIRVRCGGTSLKVDSPVQCKYLNAKVKSAPSCGAVVLLNLQDSP